MHNGIHRLKENGQTDMKIVTLTLCPAIDVHIEANGFEAYRENLCRIMRREAGGKGVNISRALLAYGIPSLALTVLGDENGEEFKKELLSEPAGQEPRKPVPSHRGRARNAYQLSRVPC